MSVAAPDLERLIGLLADRALLGLDPRDEAELAELLRAVPDVDAGALEETAARLDVALAPEPTAPLDPTLRRGLVSDLAARFGPGEGGRRSIPAPPEPVIEERLSPPAPSGEAAVERQIAARVPAPWIWAGAGFAVGSALTAAVLRILGSGS